MDDEKTPEPPTGFTDVGNDNWKAPKPSSGAWDNHVQTVDTIEKDDQGELWAYLVWNDKNDDGRFYRSKARLTTCNKACPQRVCFKKKQSYFSTSSRRKTNLGLCLDAAILREARVSVTAIARHLLPSSANSISAVFQRFHQQPLHNHRK